MEYAGETYYFCSPACHDKFHANPGGYVKPGEAVASPARRALRHIGSSSNESTMRTP
jgi:ADP-ribose pyrophosphatase YjhB (NUDIX family)